MVRHFLSATVLGTLLFPCTPLQAQIAFGDAPHTVTSPGKLHHVVMEEMPAVEATALFQEDEERALSGEKSQRFGVSHGTDLGLTTAGVWDELPDGSRVWRVGIHCPGAVCVSLVFDRFDVPDGAHVFVVDEEMHFIGGFTRESCGGMPSMAVMPVSGEYIVVEYQVPAGVRAGDLHIGQVTHGYRDPNDPERTFNASGSCNNNVVCPEGGPWAEQIRSVAKIINGGDWCTGQLINNCSGNGTPYFLTANHCVSGQNVGNWVFLFNYQSAQCSPSVNGPTAQTVSGASLLYNNAGSDVALLQLSSTPPSSYNVFYTGWDKSGTTPVNQTCIHHPQGDVKKISFDNNAAAQATYSSASCWRILNWDDGTTEPGSSGSGLWDQNKRLIGQLYGGQATCSNNVNDYFGRFDVSYPALSTWLGSCGNTLNGFDPNAPTVALDVQLNAINGFTGNSCSASRVPAVVVRNGGSMALTSFTLQWNLNGGPPTQQSWNGNLLAGATTTITLPAQSLVDGANTFTATVSTPNGGMDLVPANNSAQSTTVYGTTTATLQLNLDRYGNETTWQVLQGVNVVASGGPYVQQSTNGIYPQSPIGVCLADGCYDLKVVDSYGDGMCCTYGAGSYTLTANGSTLVNSNGQFTGQQLTNFCITTQVKVMVQAFLEGPFDAGTGWMHDSLRVKGLIPLTEPYSALGYTHMNGGGGETTTNAVLSTTGSNAIVDWVVVELRNAASPGTVLATKCGLIQRDGDITATDGMSPLAFSLAPGSYHVAVRHRSHLGCMTSSTIPLSGVPATVDLRSASIGTYGTEARKTSGTYRLLWAGNTVRDGSLLYTGAANDRDPILVRIGSTVPTNTVPGYFGEDVNMDGLSKYTGAGNDRDPILVNVGSVTPTTIRIEQLP